jgi:hypothetical protein
MARRSGGAVARHHSSDGRLPDTPSPPAAGCGRVATVPGPVRIAVARDTRPDMYDAVAAAVRAGGGRLADVEDARALVWADPARADDFPLIARPRGTSSGYGSRTPASSRSRRNSIPVMCGRAARRLRPSGGGARLGPRPRRPARRHGRRRRRSARGCLVSRASSRHTSPTRPRRDCHPSQRAPEQTSHASSPESHSWPRRRGGRLLTERQHQLTECSARGNETEREHQPLLVVERQPIGASCGCG